ncbi:hypothetical protein TELCIR_02681 [Teladorsagia circumcincta]|uniref:TIL domain-containing protein n=1 Tax=Teladorsagia circumcincta TaxID=45464 RepID=A0A2G9UYI7_TELCI|nr:hypothetical protein TELCIR_02681 [Teladorsagia circumcincta]
MFHKSIIFILLIAVVFGDTMDEKCKGKNEQYYGCKPGPNTCNFRGPSTGDCSSGCSCKPGYMYKNHVCVPVGPDCQ